MSFALGTAISTYTSRAIIERFFQVDMRDTSEAYRSAFWVIYAVDWAVVAKLLLILFAVAALVFSVWLLTVQKTDIRLLAQNGIGLPYGKSVKSSAS